MNWKKLAAAMLTLTLSVNLGTPGGARATEVNLGALFQRHTELSKAGKHQESLAIAERMVAMAKARFGENAPHYAMALNALAMDLEALNRDPEAEPPLRNALAINQKNFGPDNPRGAVLLQRLAMLLKRLNRLPEAEVLARRAMAIHEKNPGGNPSAIAQDLNVLAQILTGMNMLAEAEPLTRRAMAISERIHGRDNPHMAILLNTLASLLAKTNRQAEAERVYRRALAIVEKSHDASHADKAQLLANLARTLSDLGRADEAGTMLRQALALYEKSVTPDDLRLAEARHSLALLLAGRGDWAGAMPLARQANDAHIANARRFRESSGSGEKAALNSRTFSFQLHALAAYRVGRDDGALRDEAFVVAQRARASFAERAMAQTAARLGASSDSLSQMVREQQDLVHAREGADMRLLGALGKGDVSGADAFRARLKEFDTRLATLGERLKTEFPNYAALAMPEPLDIAGAQALLSPDEALILFLPFPGSGKIGESGLAWTITRTEARWIETSQGGPTLLSQVEALRCGLDASGWFDVARSCQKTLNTQYPGDGQPLPFDLGRAYGIYASLFAPFADLIKGKRLLIIPSRPTANLPFQALTTEPPVTGVPADWSGYAGAKWFGREHAITLLPSVASLATLRGNIRPSQAEEPYIGFGDPVLVGNGGCGLAAIAPDHCPGEGGGLIPTPTPSVRGAKPTGGVGGASGVFHGALADVEAVRKLCPLPDTAHELKCVGRSLGALSERVITGRQATENAVKSAPLDHYRIVHFATHGLMASDFKQMIQNTGAEKRDGAHGGQPALVLTPPAAASAQDDGLLTAGEITHLKLDADWVVLSACNTASAGMTGGEALSGLARAFFYAGARAVMVSQWEVDSDAATLLTTGAFKALRDAPDISQAEALRRSAVALMDDASNPRYAHPTTWAPFQVVGGR
jgi:CHAT domain-containing protein/tetratricopeptide (TPR) repeat protein